MRQIYDFTDKSGRRLALRPEMTPTLARMVAARQAALTFPLKWHAIAQCFRYERMTRGRKREHYQWNLDIVGEPSVAAEAEVVAAALHALGLLGLGPADVRVRVSSRAVLSDLLRSAGIPSDKHAAAFLAMDKRDKLPDAEMTQYLRDAGFQSREADAMFDLFRISDVVRVRTLLGETNDSLRGVTDFLSLLQTYGIADAVQFDLSVVRGLSYYTGIVFEAHDTDRKFRALFGGGRYDNLLSEVGGKPATAVGLGFGDVAIAELLAARGVSCGAIPGPRLAIGFMQEEQRRVAVAIAAAERRRGTPVDLALRPEKAKQFFSRCSKIGALEAAYVGPDDVASGALRIKNMSERSERPAPIADLLRLPADAC